MAVAFLYMFNNRTNKVPAFNLVYRNIIATSGINVYVHLTDSVNNLPDLEGVTQVPTMQTKYGEFSLVEVMLQLLETAMQNIDNMHFVFLSETDIPLFSPETIYTFLNQMGQVSWFHRHNNLIREDDGVFDDYTKMGWLVCNADREKFADDKYNTEITYAQAGQWFVIQNGISSTNHTYTDYIYSRIEPEWRRDFIDILGRLDLSSRYISMFYNSDMYHPRTMDYTYFPRRFFRQGRQQHMLCRNHAQLILDVKYRYIDLFRQQNFAADETFFLSVLALTLGDTFEQEVHWIPNAISHAEFGIPGTGSSARVFSVATELETIRNLSSLFLRKVMYDMDNLDGVMRLFNRTSRDLMKTNLRKLIRRWI